ncbi:MAG TPA: DUF4388 domain-containing protein [Planctomycetota bacterium]
MRASPQQNSSRTGRAEEARERVEVLARTVVRCRELAQHLEAVALELPERSEAPFLRSQLEDVLRRLAASLRPLGGETAPAEKPVGFLRRLALKKAIEPRAKSEVRYDLEGNAWTIPVTELVGFLSHSGKSGLLWITAPEETFALEFERGSLVHATSNAPPAAWRLGEILLREKLIEQQELTTLIDKARAVDERLGSFLVHSGRLGHAELQRAMMIQVQQLFHRLMDADNALFRFQEGAQLTRSHSLEVNITHLLLESARRKDERRLRAESKAEPEPDLHVLDLSEPPVAVATTETKPPAAVEDAPAGAATPAAPLPAPAPADELSAKPDPSPVPPAGP